MRNLLNDMLDAFRVNGLHLKRGDEPALLAYLAEAERLVTAFERKRDEIGRDPRLTPAGRADAVRTAARETLLAIEKWHAPRRTGLAQHETAVLAELAAAVARPCPTDVAARVESALLRAEIRRAAAGMSTQELEMLYRSGNAAVRVALDELPRIEHRNNAVTVSPFVSPEVRDGVLLEAAAQARPDLADLLHDVRASAAVYQSVAVAARRIVGEAAPDAIEPAIKIA